MDDLEQRVAAKVAWLNLDDYTVEQFARAIIPMVLEEAAEIERLREALRMLDEAYCNDDYSTSEGKAKGRAALIAARAAVNADQRLPNKN